MTIVNNRGARPCDRCPSVPNALFGDFTGSYCYYCWASLCFDERLWHRSAVMAKKRIVRRLQRSNVYAEWGDESKNEFHYTVKEARRSARLAH